MPPSFAFKRKTVLDLQAAVRDNIKDYSSARPFVVSADHLRRVSIPLPAKINLDALELQEPDASSFRDLENCVRVHKALGGLTPLEASDPRLWVRLAHIEQWKYMRKRWPVEQRGTDVDERVRYVSNRYFIAQAQSRALVRHGIARLWWYSHLTYDRARANPYELTGVLLETLDITQQLTERNYGRSRIVMRGFLEFLVGHADLTDSGGKARAAVRHLAKQLNLYGGIGLLDALSEGEITRLLEKELGRMDWP